MFSKTNLALMQITINGENIRTKKKINVFGVNFDSKLQWEPQVCKALTKANKALNAIKLIKNYSNTNEPSYS